MRDGDWLGRLEGLWRLSLPLHQEAGREGGDDPGSEGRMSKVLDQSPRDALWVLSNPWPLGVLWSFYHTDMIN